jgi:putative transposase
MPNRTPITTGDIIHAYNRGTRKLDIFHDEPDMEYFLQALFYFNDSHSIPNIFEELREKYPDFLKRFLWPPDWAKRDPLVLIHAYVAMPNHFHLVLEEICENGISLFMQKLGTGMTGRYNIRYKTSGNLFQGRYKYMHVRKDEYLQYLGAYVQVKNVFELYAGGFESAMKAFGKAFDFAGAYRYGSLSHYLGKHATPIISVSRGEELFFEVGKKSEYRSFTQGILRTPDFEEILGEAKLD